MSLSNAFEAELLALIFQNDNIANIGDATGLRGSTVAGSLYVALHTADPGETGDQTTSEANYTSYARVAVARTTGGWTIAGTAPTVVSNAAVVTFPKATGGTSVVTHYSVGVAASGASMVLFKGALASSLSVSVNITPEFAAGDIDNSID